jgi:anti-anti-sigma regulatory factor
VLVCPDRNVKRIFEITLLDRVFTIVDTREEAFDELASSAAS